MTYDKRNRLLELLSEQSIFGLNQEELMELKQLKNQFPDLDDDDLSFELAAAKIGLTNVDINEPLPESLRMKIVADAEQYFNFALKQNEASELSPETQRTLTAVPVIKEQPATGGAFWQWFGWAAAAAACVALVINIWSTRIEPSASTAKNSPAIQTPVPELSPSQKREQFLSTASDLVKVQWESPQGTKDIAGDVVWSNSQQKGFMRFRGLPVNNPSKETYQLWIFDEAQNDKYPINGGVFDVNENGEVIIPIDAEINVQKPKMFAVTGEKPGGVVVSNREKLLVIAKV